MVARSSNDGKPWKCRCGTVNYPTKHRMFNLPAFQCRKCRKKLALDFKFCLGEIEVNGKSLLGEVRDQRKEPVCVAFAYSKAAEVIERGVSIRNGTDPDLVIPINPSKLEKRYVVKFPVILSGDSLTKNLGVHKALHMGLILRSEGVDRIDVRSTTKPEEESNDGEPYKIGDVCTIPSDSFEEICKTLAEGTPLVGTYLAGKRRSRLPYCKIYKSPSKAAVRAKKAKEIGHAVVLVGAGMKRGKKYFYFLNSWGKKFCPRKNKKGEVISGGIGKLRAEDLTKNLIKLCPEGQTGGERRLQDQSEFKISRINYILMTAKDNQCKPMRLQELRVEANSKYVPADYIEDDIFRDDEGGIQVELEDPVENIGAKLVRQAAAKTNDLAGDGTTTSMVLAQGLIAEGVKVVAAGANPVQITRGIEKTTKTLVEELCKLSKDVEDSELADVAAISAGNNYEIGRKGVVTLEEGRSSENFLYVVDEIQFDRGHISPYFVTDSEKMSAEYENCKLLLVDKITNARDLISVLEEAITGAYPILIIAEDIEQEALATLVVNKLRGSLKIAAIKAPGFGERKTQYLDDIAILTGATVIRDQVGLSLDKADKSVLGTAAKVVLTKESTTIVGDDSTQEEVTKRVAQIKNLIEAAGQEYEKEKLNERIAKLAGGVAVIQVGAQTETELKEKKLRVEDALNATKAAVEEGIVVGGGYTLLRLAAKVDAIKDTLENNVQKVGAEIVRRALSYPLKLIAKNAGVNGSVVTEKVISNDNFKYGYNAATGQDEDLMAAGIIGPTKGVRCCLEHAAAVAKTFLTSDVVVVDVKKPEAAPLTNPMDNSAYGY